MLIFFLGGGYYFVFFWGAHWFLVNGWVVLGNFDIRLMVFCIGVSNMVGMAKFSAWQVLVVFALVILRGFWSWELLL